MIKRNINNTRISTIKTHLSKIFKIKKSRKSLTNHLSISRIIKMISSKLTSLRYLNLNKQLYVNFVKAVFYLTTLYINISLNIDSQIDLKIENLL